MSPLDIVVQTQQFLTSNIQNHLPKKLHGLFGFGVQALTLQPLVSCNGNARMARNGTRQAAEQQMYRLLRHPKISTLVWQAIAKQVPLTERSLVNIDYSNLYSLAVLGFAAQTKHGRARPVLMRSLASNTQGQKKTDAKYHQLKVAYAAWKKEVQADQYSFVIKSLRLLRYLYGCQPRLVLDRGFVNPGLVTFLCDESWVFYLRMRSDYYVEYNGGRQTVASFAAGTYSIVWSGQSLRLVVGKRRKRDQEPWYILTNDCHTTNATILRHYYHRFEIEESFRDLKSVFRLKGSRLRTYRSLQVILCFMSLSLISALGEGIIVQLLPQYLKTHTKKRLSLVRIWQETMQRGLRLAALTDWVPEDGCDV